MVSWIYNRYIYNVFIAHSNSTLIYFKQKKYSYILVNNTKKQGTNLKVIELNSSLNSLVIKSVSTRNSQSSIICDSST